MTKVGQIMKEKYDKFMEDMNLREEAWAYEKLNLIRWLIMSMEKLKEELKEG